MKLVPPLLFSLVLLSGCVGSLKSLAGEPAQGRLVGGAKGQKVRIIEEKDLGWRAEQSAPAVQAGSRPDRPSPQARVTAKDEPDRF